MFSVQILEACELSCSLVALMSMVVPRAQETQDETRPKLQSKSVCSLHVALLFFEPPVSSDDMH